MGGYGRLAIRTSGRFQGGPNVKNSYANDRFLDFGLMGAVLGVLGDSEKANGGNALAGNHAVHLGVRIAGDDTPKPWVPPNLHRAQRRGHLSTLAGLGLAHPLGTA